jgi:hypothetical protein
MLKTLLVLTLILISANISTAQTFKPGFGATGFETIQSDSWGNDILVSNGTPSGQMSVVSRPNGEVFVAVPDTTPGFSLRIYKSTNFGETFSLFPTGIQPGGMLIPKTKMVRSGLDSIYCSFMYNDTLYIWNVESNNFGVFSTVTVNDYDITASSTGGVYIIVDERVDRDIRLYGSSNGGVNFGYTLYLSGAGANPKMRFSSSGDTAVINYRGPVHVDTNKSRIRTVRYRESILGSLTQVGTFSDVVADSTIYKDQYQSVAYNGTIWTFYTQGLSPNRVIKCRTSTNYGVSYNPEFIVAGDPGHDNYWFDANIYKFGSGGVDLVYYDDTTSTYVLNYTSNTIGSPETFGAPLAINDYETSLSPYPAIPQVTEFYDAGGEVGVIYLGYNTGPESGIYYDRLSAVTNIQPGTGIASSFELKQNYPNPFNPSTKIAFSIPKNGFTSLKIYDMVGREVATLLSKDLQSGKYEVDFNGSKLASGVYFYKLMSNDFVEVKKMMLVK